jgi:nitrogen regulatory protein P-II 1
VPELKEQKDKGRHSKSIPRVAQKRNSANRKINNETIKTKKNMKKIEAVIRKSKFEDVKEALYDAGIEWFSYWDITGLGKSTEEQIVRGQVFQSSYIHRRMISIVVRDINLEKTLDAILNSAWTGETGDGKIFIYDIQDTIRIRTRESGPEALFNKE